MIRLAVILAGTLLLVGCGAEYQQTPEPNEMERVNELVEQLGTTRTYNSKTLLLNPEPDGRILMGWIDRRRATLDQKLPFTSLPALNNPGIIRATLAWERETRKSEAGNGNAVNRYMLDYERRGCNRVAEAAWFSREQDAHAKGLRKTLVDWDKVNAQFQAKCDAKAIVENARLEHAKIAAQARDAQLLQDKQACREPWETANSIYAESPSEATGSTLTAASRAMEVCLQVLEESYGEPAGR